MKKLVEVEIHVAGIEGAFKVKHPTRAKDQKHLFQEITGSSYFKINKNLMVKTDNISLIYCDMVDLLKVEELSMIKEEIANRAPGYKPPGEPVVCESDDKRDVRDVFDPSFSINDMKKDSGVELT